MTTDQQEPLIYTSRGNIPLSSLQYQYAWEDTPEYVKFVERYVASDGEVVKESAHVMAKRGMSMLGETGKF